MSFGKLEAPRPPFSDQAAKRLMVVVGIVLIVVGSSRGQRRLAADVIRAPLAPQRREKQQHEWP
jgi:hypothetical protein